MTRRTREPRKRGAPRSGGAPSLSHAPPRGPTPLPRTSPALCGNATRLMRGKHEGEKEAKLKSPGKR